MVASSLLLRAAAFRPATTATSRCLSHRSATRLFGSLPRSPAAVIFDMDGTLVDHSIDFASLRSRIWEVVDDDEVGRTFGERECVLEVAGKLSPEGQARCKLIFDDIEKKAVDEMSLAAGGPELIRYLSERKIQRAVLTRNLERNVGIMAGLYSDAVCDAGGLSGDGDVFHHVVARDTPSDPSDPASEPVRSKPSPDGILHLCRLWGVGPSEVIFVGDNANDDIVAANAAGCGGSVLVTPGGVERDTHSGYALGESEEDVRLRTPSLRVESLGELMERMMAEAEEDPSEGDGDGGEEETRRAGEGTMVYDGGGFSVVVPSIGVKGV
ncbi:hypothetical protein THAOC_01554 [Thalassiosira oceanica]|uniref:Uncharacterized protein n=1 Tax=Thalassiosira oceanica TaxID=159749 RepID=K0TMZ7_THAOC|nr:hypothetical protein THAOC_01554 [Thalassiosira oceanica]|eukprot:EJK76671.1 hypothetical protein THAOC_01554 [Thalassiosira oceanica]